jgi:hypothetical protein
MYGDGSLVGRQSHAGAQRVLDGIDTFVAKASDVDVRTDLDGLENEYTMKTQDCHKESTRSLSVQTTADGA